MRVLGIETSCDETSVALVDLIEGVPRLTDQLVSSQIPEHRPFGGVVPEVAVRQHLLHLPGLTRRLLEQTGCPLSSVDAIGVTRGPGLVSSLMVGLGFAKALALATAKPWIGVNHLEGHLISPFLSAGIPPRFPHIALIVSGGHTLLIHALSSGHYHKLGGTLDDAAGEAFDKTAKLLGLGYPGGPLIEQEALRGNPAAFAFPRALLHQNSFDFSFSGLKTAVRVHLQNHPDAATDPQKRADTCASFQKAVLDVLATKTLRACRHTGAPLFTLSGGVGCNRALRAHLETMAGREGLDFLVAPPHLSTDNAGMIASVAALRLHSGETSSPWDTDADPNLRLAAA
jgi:N6-L-threonylcarbamoyladenine synthase